MKHGYKKGHKQGYRDAKNDVFSIPENASDSYRSGYVDGAAKRESEQLRVSRSFRHIRRNKRAVNLQFA